jgi:hypothetical protein
MRVDKRERDTVSMFKRAERIIDDLRARGIRLRSDGRTLWASGAVTVADAETITTHKAALLEYFEWHGARECVRSRLAECRRLRIIAMLQAA